MQDQLKVTLIQTHLHWENPVANRSHLKERIQSITEDTHLIVLPEMFTTGFSMNPAQLAETMQGETVQWLKQLAQEKDAAICGSMMITENENYYNRFYRCWT